MPSENNRADNISRQGMDNQAFRLHRTLFENLWCALGVRPQVDAFATKQDTRCPHYIAYQPCPSGSMNPPLRIDALSCNLWDLRLVYAFCLYCSPVPLTCLVPPCRQQANTQNCSKNTCQNSRVLLYAFPKNTMTALRLADRALLSAS